MGEHRHKHRRRPKSQGRERRRHRTKRHFESLQDTPKRVGEHQTTYGADFVGKNNGRDEQQAAVMKKFSN